MINLSSYGSQLYWIYANSVIEENQIQILNAKVQKVKLSATVMYEVWNYDR